MSDGPVPPQPLDVFAWVTVRLHQSGAISTSGTIGDKPMALYLLREGYRAIKGSVKDEPLIVMPAHEVHAEPIVPVRDLGSMPENERGDP